MHKPVISLNISLVFSRSNETYSIVLLNMTWILRLEFLLDLVPFTTFIMDHDGDDIHHYFNKLESNKSQAAPAGEPGHGSIPRAEHKRVDASHDGIAMQMWESYFQFLQDHAEVLEQEFDLENEETMEWSQSVTDHISVRVQ
jgi:hypothetical protein